MAGWRYDALLVDFYGTLSAGDREVVERACARIVTTLGLNVTAQELAIRWGERFFATVDASNHNAFRTLHACELDSLRDTLAEFACHEDPEPFVADIEAYWVDPPLHRDAAVFLAWLERLSAGDDATFPAQTLPVCCVSNADSAPLMSAIRKHGLRFNAIITSEAARSYKPDPGIFRVAIETLGVEPARVMHVGDSLHSDVAGAARLGITTTWLCREGRIHDIGSSQPDHTITSLAELPALLT